VELAKNACKRNESVARYIGDNFSVEYNKKLRKVRDRFAERIDDRIDILKIKPFVLVRRSSYNDDSRFSSTAKTMPARRLWIEILLDTPIEDYRKEAIRKIIANPLLVTL
jgi:GGDEF domain-containing protein